MIKRGFDIAGSAAGLLLCAPAFVVMAVWIKAGSPGPVFFRQRRVGRHGVEFSIFKFRTMVTEAPKLGPQITVGAADPRITRAGAVLRRLKLDELPQLINVLRGDMSFVGPRPEVPKYVSCYDPRQRRVLDVRPGITDPASLAFRNENELLGAESDPERAYVEVVMPRKLEMNIEYLERRTLWTDFGIIVRTLGCLVGR